MYPQYDRLLLACTALCQLFLILWTTVISMLLIMEGLLWICAGSLVDLGLLVRVTPDIPMWWMSTSCTYRIGTDYSGLAL